MSANIIAIVNQKGGVGKTTTCVNLGIGLAREGKRVLLLDSDPQGSLTISLGCPEPDQVPTTLTQQLNKVLLDAPINPKDGILHNNEGVDLLPANIELSGMDISLLNVKSRYTVLKQYLDTVKPAYDFILLDCMPSLGMMTMNAMAAADSVLIPVQSHYLSAKGLEQLLHSIKNVRREINPKLRIEGILLTMADNRTNNTKVISDLIRETYGANLKVFNTAIPQSVRAAETAAEGKSIYAHDPHGKVAQAYKDLSEEVLALEKQRRKYKAESIR